MASVKTSKNRVPGYCRIAKFRVMLIFPDAYHDIGGLGFENVQAGVDPVFLRPQGGIYPRRCYGRKDGLICFEVLCMLGNNKIEITK
ncbi:MAG: hypothetical protein COA36_01160 [Desulfotalea sp.]|nr:MAG: hypothetical protein COA36_01160 [Desulfotalea sp.]